LLVGLEANPESSHQFRAFLRVRERQLYSTHHRIIKQLIGQLLIHIYLTSSPYFPSKLFHFLRKYFLEQTNIQTSNKMSSQTSSAHKQYYLITNVQASSSSSTTTTTSKDEIDLHSESWKLPYSIDDEDLTFDGKPLNMLYEENRYYETRDRGEKKSRGRSRKK